jgi:cytidylate kinase
VWLPSTGRPEPASRRSPADWQHGSAPAISTPAAVTAVVQAATIEISTDPVAISVLLDGQPVDEQIRSATTTKSVSAVSAVPEVRTLLVDLQRRLIGTGGIVVEGRDIGSVVWPGAQPKVFLTASPLARAERRAAETGDDVAAVAADIQRRDHLDSTRATSPLARSEDAVELDTTDLDIDQVVDRLVDLAGAVE